MQLRGPTVADAPLIVPHDHSLCKLTFMSISYKMEQFTTFTGLLRRNEPAKPEMTGNNSSKTEKIFKKSEITKIKIRENQLVAKNVGKMQEDKTEKGSTEDQVDETADNEADADELSATNQDDSGSSSDSTTDIADLMTEIDEDEYENEHENFKQLTAPAPPKKYPCKVILLWFLFWFIATFGGISSFYMTVYKEISVPDLNQEQTNKIDKIDLILMPREKWDDTKYVVTKPTSYVAQQIVAVHTNTDSCDDSMKCSKLLNGIKRQQGTLKYNFMLATDGCIYEGLGWQEPSPLYPEIPTMVVAFIGNYDLVAPSKMQIYQMHALINASEQLTYLESYYTIHAGKVGEVPIQLSASLSKFDRWFMINTDIDEENLEFEPSPMFK